MALQLASVVTNGFRRALTRTGAVLFVFLLATQLLLVTSLNTVMAAAMPAGMSGQIGLTLPVSQTVAGGVFAGTYLLTSVYFVVVARGMARPLADLSEFPSTLYTRRMGRATLSMLVGSVLVFVAVLIGFVLFVIPGLVLAACFLSYIFTVGVEDRGVLGGLKRSWALSRGNRLRLVALAILIGVLGGLVGAVPALAGAAGSRAVGDVLTVLANSLLFVAIYGMIATAYLQLSAGDAIAPRGGSSSPSASDLSAQ